MTETDYLVVVVRFADTTPRDRVAQLLARHMTDTVTAMPLDSGATIAAPTCQAEVVERLLAELPPLWAASATRPLPDITAAHREAGDVLALVVAAGKPAGRYHLDDVLLEYAIARDPVVAGRLVAVIQPLLDNEALRETLEALIRSDFHRTRAARALFIHRSTLDYRIRRIGEITGYCPLTSRGAHALTAAMTASVLADAA